MTAGRGSVHSERTPPELRAACARLFGMQTWIGLPREREEIAPSFVPHPESALPVLEGDGKYVRVIAGIFQGARSPLAVFSDTLYADAMLAAGARLELRAEYPEHAIYIAEGRIEIAQDDFEGGRMLVVPSGDAVVISATAPAPAPPARRRAARRAAAPLVELRLELRPPYRAGKSRLAGRPVPECDRGNGIHTASRIAFRQGLRAVTGVSRCNLRSRCTSRKPGS